MPSADGYADAFPAHSRPLPYVPWAASPDTRPPCAATVPVTDGRSGADSGWMPAPSILHMGTGPCVLPCCARRASGAGVQRVRVVPYEAGSAPASVGVAPGRGDRNARDPSGLRGNSLPWGAFCPMNRSLTVAEAGPATGTPRTVLGALVARLHGKAAARIPSVFQAWWGGVPHDLICRTRPGAVGRP